MEWLIVFSVLCLLGSRWITSSLQMMFWPLLLLAALAVIEDKTPLIIGGVAFVVMLIATRRKSSTANSPRKRP